MECNCSVTDYDCAELYKSAIVKAKKQHTCCECHEPIPKGEKYENVVGLYDGVFTRFKTCIPCVSIRTKYCPDGFLHEGLNESIGDCLGMDYVTGVIYWDD